jgi:alkanesulfonate monooxygenase SsuD/methylene tetrahydromethanopterin reductase-like flavin-dependent oxidoreductase (luciferase family)
MTDWVIRYDLRAPAWGTPVTDLYAAALEQCEWADRLGAQQVILSEHHGCDDGYLPSPLVFAAAIAARTDRIRIRISAVVITLRDPLQAAEDVIVVDHVSRGRIEVICVAGYVPSEFAMFGVPFDGRWRVYEEKVRVFARALTGEPFEHDMPGRGSTVQVTPAPFQRPRPPVLLGGAVPSAPLRAARLADGYMPPIPDPALYEAYLAERVRLGKPAGELVKPSGPLFVHVADDPDRAWAAIAPHALHEANEYAKWAALVPGSNPWVPMEDADMLRAQGLYAVVTPDECVALAGQLEEGSKLILHPLMGGLAPDLAWESLDLFEAKVLPRLTAGAGTPEGE